LIRGLQSADDQFQALQTQVTEGFQSMDFRLQEQEAEVALQINAEHSPSLIDRGPVRFGALWFLLSSSGF
jgi:hypothetical protein